jgi:hypothetical protein
MKEYSLKTDVNAGTNGGEVGTGNVVGGYVGPNNAQELPTKQTTWGKIRAFLFQEIDLTKPIVLELTPKEEKVLNEVHDFLFQEVKFPELHDFLFQEVTIFGKKNK